MLTGKYLKYTKEITFKVFEKILKKLSNNDWTSAVYLGSMGQYTNFIDKRHLVYYDTKKTYGFHSAEVLHTDDIEIQVSDILGEDWNKSKELTKDDLVEGEIYLYMGHYILKYNATELVMPEINTDSSEFERCCWDFNSNPIIIATSHQKKWLNVCIKQDKFIKEDSLDDYDDIAFELKTKSIEKWSVGSWAVVVNDGFLGHGYVLVKKLKMPIGYYAEISSNYKDSTTAFKDNKYGPWIFEKDLVKWFATEQEAKEYSQSLKSTVMDKTISKWTINSWVVCLDNYGGMVRGNIDRITKLSNEDFSMWLDREGSAHGPASSFFNECFKWFATKQGAVDFSESLNTISVEKLTPEGVEPELKPKKSKFNRWYKNPKSKWMMFITSETEGYGFDVDNSWVEYSTNTIAWTNVVYDRPEPTNKEVEERLLEYANRHYPIGTEYEVLDSGSFKGDIYKSIRVPIVMDDNSKLVEVGIGYCYYHGKWAKVIGNPTTLSLGDQSTTTVKPGFDRNWYVKVNSQEEADKVFAWLEDQGEEIARDGSSEKYTKNIGCVYITCIPDTQWWVGDSNHIKNKIEKKLSDILPEVEGFSDSIWELSCAPIGDTDISKYMIGSDPYIKKEPTKCMLLVEEKIPLVKVTKEVIKKSIKPNYSLL